MRLISLFVALTLVALTLPMSLGPVDRARIIVQDSPATNLMYVSPSNITNLPVNTQFNVSIQVVNMSEFLGWDVIVQFDPTVINATSIIIAGNLFDANYTSYGPSQQIADCINGYGPGCIPPPTGVDGIGVASSAGTGVRFGVTSISPLPITGTLLVITFNVTRSVGFSPIQIYHPSIQPTSTLEDGTKPPVQFTTLDGTYGKPVGPDFKLSVNPIGVSVAKGSSARANVTISSILGFTGRVNLTSSQELTSIIENQTLIVPKNGSNSTSLVVVTNTTTTIASYVITITAYNATTTRTTKLSVSIGQPGSFTLSINPGLLRIHGGRSANSTILLTGLQRFNGTVHLSLSTFRCTQSCTEASVPGLFASVGSQDIVLTNGSAQSTSLNVTTPVSLLSFIYRIDVLATSKSFSSPPQSLLVTPPVASLAVNFNPASITIGAGNSTTVSVNVQSVDYFSGWVYAQSVMNGGITSLDQPNYDIVIPKFVEQPWPSANFTLTIKIFTGAIPGNYVLLLTVYSVETIPITLPNSLKIPSVVPLQLQVGIPIRITDPALFRVVPAGVFGVAPMAYFVILGALALPFALLTVRAVRNYKEDREDPDWKL